MNNKTNKILGSLIALTIASGSIMPLVNVVNNSVIYATSSTQNVEKVFKFNYTEKTISIGKSLRNTPIKRGINTKSKVQYTSSNQDVALIDDTGKVTGMARGTSVITATLDGMAASYTLKVIPGNISVYSAEDDEKIKGTVILDKNEQRKFYIQDEYNSILDSEVEWTSSKEKVCTVDQDGNVKSVGDGYSTITASIAEIEKAKANLRISVKTAVKEIEADEIVTTYVGETAKINYIVFPEDASNSRLKFEVEDKDIATVSSKGEIKAKEAGTTVVKVSSVSNPEVETEVELEVKEERDFKNVMISAIIANNPEVSSTSDSKSKYVLPSYSDASYRVAKNETISILNDYGADAKFTNNNTDIIKITNDEDIIKVKGLKDGAATITVDYSGMKDTIKVISGNYIDRSALIRKNTNQDENDSSDTNNEKKHLSEKEIKVEKIKQIEDPDDPTKNKDYVKDYPLEVGVSYDFTLKVSPTNAPIDDLTLKLSNNKDFIIENGMIKAKSPNKSTDLIISSKKDPKVTTKIRLKSSIGNVKAISFAKGYVGDNALDINKYKTYSFNPVFYMESGRVYDPVSNPEIVDDEVYKALKKNVKISCEDTDVIEISSNRVRLKKGVNGTGILKIEYDKKKNSRSSEDAEDIVAETNFEAIGVVNETIKSIKFAKTSYDIATGETIAFNPIFILSEGTKLDPSQDGVVESEKYQQLLKEVGLLSGTETGEYVDAVRLLNFNYLGNGNTDNTIRTVYEGKCKIKMVVHSDNRISAETSINIKSPYVLKNMEGGVKVSKEYKKTMYVNTDKLKIVDDVNGNGESGEITRGSAIWAFEKYSNGYMRVAYNGNENLYVEAKYLAEKKEQTVKKSTSSSSSSSRKRSSSSSSSSSRKSSSSSSSSSSSKRSSSSNSNSSSNNSSSNNSSGNNSNKSSDKKVTTTYIRSDRYTNTRTCVYSTKKVSRNYLIRQLPADRRVYVSFKDSDGWAKITSPVSGWVKSDNLKKETQNWIL